MAVARLTSSHGKRERGDVHDVVRQFFVADAGEPLDVLFGLLLDDVDDVVDGQDADQPLVLVDDGGRQQIVLLEDLRRLFLVHLGRDRMARLVA